MRANPNYRLRTLSLNGFYVFVTAFILASLAPITEAGQAEEPAVWTAAVGTVVPIAVRLETGSDEGLIPGLQARGAKVIVRNTTDDRVVAIRGARWWEAGVESLNWHGPMQGSSLAHAGPGVEGLTDKPGDTLPASVRFHRDAAAMTGHHFEQGLLLPGQAIAVPLRFTPQQYGSNTVQIDFITVGDEESDWRDQVLIAGPAPAFNGEILVQPGDRAVEMHQGHGGLGLIEATMHADSAGPDIQSAHFELSVPIADTYDLAQTGGLTREEAAGRAGATIEEMNYLGYYFPGMKTWFFVRGDGEARTLRQVDGEWVFDFTLNMPAFAPELFGRSGAPTMALMNPDVFSGVIDCSTPSEDRYYDPGLTPIPADDFWPVLEHAGQKKGVRFDAVVINPTGVSRQWVLTLAVRVDAAGRWEHPVIETPEEVPGADTSPADAPQ